MRLTAAFTILPLLCAAAFAAEPVASSTSTSHFNAPPGGASGARTFDFAQLTAADTFTAERGYGFDLGTAPSAHSAIRVPHSATPCASPPPSPASRSSAPPPAPPRPSPLQLPLPT